MIEHSVRNLLLAIGVSRTAAAMVTPNMYQAPAVSDPKSPHIMVVVGHLQDALNTMGYQLTRTGYLDLPTAHAMSDIVGPGWERMTWADNIAAVLAAKKQPGIQMASRALASAQVPDVTLAGITGADLNFVPFLPDVPGGVITYAVGGYLLYRMLKKRS